MNTTDIIILVGYTLGVVGSAVLVVRYSWAGWWRTPEGRAIFFLHLALAWFGFLTLMRVIYGLHYPGRTFFVIVGVYGFAAAVWNMTFLLFKAQRRGKQPAAKPEIESEPVN